MKTYVITKSGIARIMRCKDYTTAEEEIAKWHLDDQATVTSVREISDADVPADASYKAAWVDTGIAIEHDIPKAREAHKDLLRVLRKPKLEALDVEYQRADEKDDKVEKRRIADLKQVLRDVPDDPRIESAQTLEALKAVIPDALK